MILHKAFSLYIAKTAFHITSVQAHKKLPLAQIKALALDTIEYLADLALYHYIAGSIIPASLNPFSL